MQRSTAKETWRRADKRKRSDSKHSKGLPVFIPIAAAEAFVQDLVNTSATIRNDLNVTQDIKVKVDQAVEDTIVAIKIIDGFRNPQSGNTYLKDHAGFPLE